AVTVAVEQTPAVLDVISAVDQPAEQSGVRLHATVDHCDSLAVPGRQPLSLQDPQLTLRRRLYRKVVAAVRCLLLAGRLLLDRADLPGSYVVHDVGHGAHAGRAGQRCHVGSRWYAGRPNVRLRGRRPRRSGQAQDRRRKGYQRVPALTQRPHSARTVR
ncbi:MAG: hypothetical protein M3325_03000, partial [Actinomycetota bacterium]|nr:hypothetical protein [Actinomycetota bacterium]